MPKSKTSIESACRSDLITHAMLTDPRLNLKDGTSDIFLKLEKRTIYRLKMPARINNPPGK